jgi:hypothetical protein
MSGGDEYRKRASEFEARAKTGSDRNNKTEFEGLARIYRRLAEQADRNRATNVVYGPSFFPRRGSGDAE